MLLKSFIIIIIVIVMLSLSLSLSLSGQPLRSPHHDVDYEFSPHLPLPPGLSADVTVVLRPSENVDFSAQLLFLSASGTFAIPMHCITKKVHAFIYKYILGE